MSLKAKNQDSETQQMLLHLYANAGEDLIINFYLETVEELALLNSIYTDLRLYVNFLQPVLKLVDKKQVDGKAIKKYDMAATPYRRVLVADLISIEIKARLSNLFVSLNPVTFRKIIDDKTARLWKLVR